MNHTTKNEDNENEDPNEADSEYFVTSSSEDDPTSIGKAKKHINKKLSNWDTTTKKYKADFEFISPHSERKDEETIEKKAVEKSPRERFFDEVLGNGSFKRVYKGYDLDDAREVAWNVINVGNMTDEEIKKIIDEINLIKKLKNPLILNYISGWVNEEKREVVFITDIFSGGSLKQYLTKIKYPRLKVIKCWCKEILKGLKYLHEQENPIIHRDIKCDNIFINKNDGKITIGDLGYSCVLKNDYANSFSGTPEFMAPEVFESKYGINADIYSFGMCLLEMITLEKPYKESENIWMIYTLATQGVPPKALNRIHNEKIKDFIKSCLKKENERPTANDLLNSEFLNDLENDENNYPVPLLDEDCKYIINHENENKDSNNNTSGVTQNLRQKLLHDDKKVNESHEGRSSIMEKSKLRTAIKNSPIHVKKPLHVKIEDNFALNQENCKNKIILKKSSPAISSKNHNHNYLNNQISPQSDIYLDSSLEFDNKHEKIKKPIKSSKSHYEINNLPFIKKHRPSVHQSFGIKSALNQRDMIYSHGNLNSFSKLELCLENEYSPENKLNDDKLVIVLKIKKQIWKNKKKIKFDYNLKIDTVEKVVNEMKSQRQLNLNDEETIIIMEKLSSFLKSLNSKIVINPTIVSRDSQKMIVEDNLHFTTERKKLTPEDFIRKYEKILNKAKKLINSVVDKDTNFSHGNNTEILDKISNLQKFVYDKINKKDHNNCGLKEHNEKVDSHKRDFKK